MRTDYPDQDKWVRSIVSPSARPAQAAPEAPGASPAVSIGLLIFIALATMLVSLLLVLGAFDRHQHRLRYENHAVTTTATVTGFDVRTFKKGGKDIKPVVTFTADDGRKVRVRLLLARLVLAPDQKAWVGRPLEIRYLPGLPDTAIAADAMEQLPRATDYWLILVAALGGTVLCIRQTVVEWRRRH